MRYITTLLFLCAMTMAEADPVDREVPRKGQHSQVATCPETPNCVSSVDQKTSKHHIEPFRHNLDEGEIMSRLRDVIEAMPRSKIIQATHNNLRAEFRSLIFRFVDDVELAVGSAPGVIHVRSASRVGYWDFGANRRRVEQIREELLKSTQ